MQNLNPPTLCYLKGFTLHVTPIAKHFSYSHIYCVIHQSASSVPLAGLGSVFSQQKLSRWQCYLVTLIFGRSWLRLLWTIKIQNRILSCTWFDAVDKNQHSLTYSISKYYGTRCFTTIKSNLYKVDTIIKLPWWLWDIPFLMFMVIK